MRRPDRWLVLSARTPLDDPLRSLIAEGLLALGGLSVVEEDELLTTYLSPPENPGRFLREAERFLAKWLLTDDVPELTWRWQANEDWETEWKRGLAPRRITDRIIVKPTWTQWAAAPGQVVIEVDPEMAFGTGEHATTRGCLTLLDSFLRPGDRVLDVGSGSGILSIAAVHLGAARVVAIESDADANINARDNIERNGVAGRIELVEATADPAVLAALGHFDVVLANILSGVIRPLLPAFRTALDEGGRLVVSGILASERETILDEARDAGLALARELADPEEGWWSAAFGIGDKRAP